jgi:ribonuclease R
MHRNIPAIYRVHEDPDERRLREYREDVLSHHIQCGNLSKRPEVQKLLAKLGTIPIGAALKIGFLRSLMRARYAVEPLGHYGLAKKRYAHFTSPIRRYADLVVHRALFQSTHGGVHSIKETADHISDTERNSADAERDSKDVKLYAFLRGQLQSPNPPRYPALVTDVRNFGFFVDVPGLAMSGLVHLSSIEDDFYVFDVQRSQLIGRRSRRVIRLGDRLEVQIAKVDSFKKQVDFRLTKEAQAQGAARPERRESRRPDQGHARRPEGRGPAQRERGPSDSRHGQSRRAERGSAGQGEGARGRGGERREGQSGRGATQPAQGQSRQGQAQGQGRRRQQGQRRHGESAQGGSRSAGNQPQRQGTPSRSQQPRQGSQGEGGQGQRFQPRGPSGSGRSQSRGRRRGR